MEKVVGAGCVVLNWTAQTGAVSYNVYRGTAAGGESNTPLVTGLTSPTYTDSSALSGVTYYYVVTAVNANATTNPGLDDESADSNEASARPSGTVTSVSLSSAFNRIGIVAFPNFAHWPNRISIARGRMPVTRRLPYQWYDTPNIRVGTLADFGVLARKNRLKILDSFGLQEGRVVRVLPNLMASVAVFKFERE